ncbi:hypothetical protein HC928_19815 [bacterium]|nr:hypothetical protein [bacterium]
MVSALTDFRFCTARDIFSETFQKSQLLFPLPMLVLPLRTILLQSLFLVMTIAVESSILQHRLKIDRPQSIQCVATLNLISTSLGWVAFFIIVPLLPLEIREQLISYIFFDKLYANPWYNSIGTATIFGIFIFTILSTFFVGFFVKLTGLEIFLRVLYSKLPAEEVETMEKKGTRLASFIDSRLQSPEGQGQFEALLQAHIASHSLILIALVIRQIQFAI